MKPEDEQRLRELMRLGIRGRARYNREEFIFMNRMLRRHPVDYNRIHAQEKGEAITEVNPLAKGVV